MASYRELLVKVGADTSGLDTGLTGVISKLGGLSSAATAVAGVTVAAIAAIGAAAFKVGLDFEDANKTIRTGTGATGEALEGLKQSAKNVFTGVPESIDQVAKTLADLNTATGLTGSDLESLTTQFLDLQRLGVGFSGDVMTLTRVFGDWGDAIQSPTEGLDFLYKASQSTGVAVDDLAQRVVQVGAPLRNLGFGFEDAVALMGRFGKEGVNTETVMSGLRMATKNLSNDARGVPAAFQGTIEAIQAAGRGAESTAIAVKAFGTLAANDMVDAIVGGKFAIDELVGSLNASQETISGAAAETATLGEKMSELGNKAMVILEPLGSFLVDVLGTSLSFVIDMFDAWWISATAMWELIGGSALPALSDFSGGIKDVANAIKDFFIGQLIKGMESTAAFLETLSRFPVIGDKFAGKAEGIRTAIEKMKGSLSATAKEIGTPAQPKSFTGSVAKAKVEVFDLEKALRESERAAKEYEKGLKDATKKGSEEFTKSVKEMSGALDDLERDSKSAQRGVSQDILDITAVLQDNLITKLGDVPTKTKDLEAAFSSLQTKGTSELQKLYDQAKYNFNLIQDSGEATPRQISEAWRNELEAQKALLEAQGKSLSQEEESILADLNRKLKSGTDAMESTWSQFAINVGATVGQLGQDLFSDLLEGKFSLSTVTSALRSIKDAFAEALFKPVKSAIDDFIANSLDKLIGKLTGTGGVSDALGKVFGGNSGGGGVASSAGGAVSSAGSAASTAAGVATSLSNPVTAIASVGSLISGIIGNFQMAKMETTLNAIEESTRRTEIGVNSPAGIIENQHEYLGRSPWVRHTDLKNNIDQNVQRLTDDSWAQNGRLFDAVQQQTQQTVPAINQTSQDMQRLASAVQQLASRPVQVLLDGNVLAEAVSTRLAYQLAAA